MKLLYQTPQNTCAVFDTGLDKIDKYASLPQQLFVSWFNLGRCEQ